METVWSGAFVRGSWQAVVCGSGCLIIFADQSSLPPAAAVLSALCKCCAACAADYAPLYRLSFSNHMTVVVGAFSGCCRAGAVPLPCVLCVARPVCFFVPRHARMFLTVPPISFSFAIFILVHCCFVFE